MIGQPGAVLDHEIRGSGPRLVLVHGFTQNRSCWGAVAADLARDHEVVLVDLPGHGGSVDVDPELGAAAAALAATGGRAVYVGYSLGARVCLRMAVDHPEVVEGLVLLSGTAGLEDPGERAARQAADEALADRIERAGVARFVDEWLALPLFAGLDATTDQRAERLRNTAPGLAASLRRAGTGTMEPLWARLRELSMPVLVLAGERDAKFVASGRRLAEGIGAGATLVVVPGAGHSAHLERPSATVAALRSWLPRVRL